MSSTLTDGAGHDYGPHHGGLVAALDETDRRIGRVLDVIEGRGLLEETLFVVTADHGMSPQDVALRANPARHVERIGMASVVAEPMIWLRDVAVAVECANDGRTARVLVSRTTRWRAVSACPSRAPRCWWRRTRRMRRVSLAAWRMAGLDPGASLDSPTVSICAPDQLAVVVRAEGRNPRRLRLQGAASRSTFAPRCTVARVADALHVAGDLGVLARPGGTFTDCIGVSPDGAVHTAKRLLTDDAGLAAMRAILEGVAAIKPGHSLPACSVKIGTTLATNALLTRRASAHAACGERGTGRCIRDRDARAAGPLRTAD